MNKTFNQVKQFLILNFPELNGKITPVDYSPSDLHANISSFVKFLQILGMMWMIVGGEKLCKLIGYGTASNPLPRWYWQIQKNGMTVVFVLFFFLPQILNSMTSKDAFEIHLNGETIFSKLDENRFPTGDELILALKNAGLEHTAQSDQQ